jgi:PEP-CTERM motif
MPLLIGSLVLLLTSSGTAQADPIVYSTSGQIRFGDGAYEIFEGSFVLSDPLVSFFDTSDSRGDQRDLYTVSDFRLSSASYSLTGQGAIAVWWELNRGSGVVVNRLDSVATLHTSAGLLDTGFNFPHWEGDPGTQPIRFSDFTQPIGPLGGSTAHILNMTAERTARVPEPSALFLYGVGIAGWALLRGRVKS